MDHSAWFFSFITALLLYCISSFAIAQSFPNFNFSQPAASASTQPSLPVTSHPPLSADEFKNAVNTLSQQNQANLNQLLNQQLASQPSTPQTNPSSANNQAASGQSDSTNTPASPPSYGSSSAQPALAPATTPTAPSQNQIYTGFGSGNNAGNATTNNPPPSSNSGSWNIKY